MSRNELKEIISKVIERVAEQRRQERETPTAACLFGDRCDTPCDVTTKYGIDEEG